MCESPTQDVTPEKVGAYVAFGDNEKQLIEDAGQALIRGDANAVESLIAAASPLCVIVTGQFVVRYKRLWDGREQFREQAREALAKAVASINRRLRNGSFKEIKSTFRAYLSKCIRFRLIRHSRQVDRAERVESMQEFQLEDSGLDWIELLSLKPIEKTVYVARRRGQQWKEIAASVKRTTRTAQRIYNAVKRKIDNPEAS